MARYKSRAKRLDESVSEIEQKIADIRVEVETDFNTAKEMLNDIDTGVIEELKDEMENWRDNIPDNLQGGEKYSAVEECVDELDRVKDEIESYRDSDPQDADELEEALSQIESSMSDATGIEFPGMFG